jgi:hypothetical protein
VLTGTGVEGWCYGYSIILREIGAEVDDEVVEEEDETLAHILSQVWRPQYFKRAIEEGRIDLQEFRTDIGLFPEPENDKMILTTKDLNFVFEYDSIITYRRGAYLFEGTELKIRAAEPERIIVEYNDEGKYREESYVIVHNNVERIVDRERERRQKLYNQIVENGTTLSSSGYGDIELPSRTEFRWSGFERLVPDIIPPGVAGSGRLDFTFFLPDHMKSEYTGAVSFYFSEFVELPVTFLFNAADEGTQFIYVPPSLINEDRFIIEREPAVPFIIFFNAAGGETVDGESDDEGNVSEPEGAAAEDEPEGE